MKFRFTFDVTHWMIGVSFGQFNSVVSIGPINIWIHNSRKFMRAEEQEMIRRVMEEEQK